METKKKTGVEKNSFCSVFGQDCPALPLGEEALQGPFLLIQSHYHPTVTVSLSPHPSQSPEQPHSPSQTSQLNHILRTNGRGRAASTVSNLICPSPVSLHTHAHTPRRSLGRQANISAPQSCTFPPCVVKQESVMQIRNQDLPP